MAFTKKGARSLATDCALTSKPRSSSASKKENKHEELLAWQIKITGLPEPKRECLFHPTRKWRFDFGWPDHGIACEVEGGVWTNGRHTRGAGFTEDCEKYNQAALLGFRVFRFTTDMVQSGKAIVTLERAFNVRLIQD